MPQPPEHYLASEDPKTGNSYSNIVRDLYQKFQFDMQAEDFLCQQCVVIIDETERMMQEARVLTQIMTRLLNKKYAIDEEIDLDIDEAASKIFIQKKSKFLCQKCDFVGFFEIQSVHMKFHEIQDKRKCAQDECEMTMEMLDEEEMMKADSEMVNIKEECEQPFDDGQDIEIEHEDIISDERDFETLNQEEFDGYTNQTIEIVSQHEWRQEDEEEEIT